MKIINFKNLKTSTQISIKFTIFTVILVMVFGLAENIKFFNDRYSKEQMKVVMVPPGLLGNGGAKIILGKNRGPDREVFELNSPEGKTILSARKRKSIIEIDEHYFIYKVIDNKVYITNVTPHIVVQKNLILTSIYLTLVFGVIAYIVSLIFVENALKKLNKLLIFLDDINIDNLHNRIEVTGHPKDEINRLINKFNESLEKINKQTLSLKDFVSNASHELKTPLMAISTEIDYAKKSKKYSDGLDSIKEQIQNINNILETLTAISKLESSHNLECKDTDLSKIAENTIETFQKLYKDKSIDLQIKISKNIKKHANVQGFGIIIKNLLDNAFKFTPNGGTIGLILDKQKLEIRDSGIGIDNKDLSKVWDRFWQADRSKTDTKSFGLGLYLTKLLVEKHGWTIAIESKLHKGTKITIKFSDYNKI